MRYGVYLFGEVMATHDNYFKACDEAQQLTRDTGIVHGVMPIMENKIIKENFNIEDIDGYEFVKDRSVGGVLISWERDDDEFLTGKVRVVYTDGSGGSISVEEAQKRIDTGHWTVIKN